MTDTHDSGYHLLFSHPEMVEDLFKNFVDEPWVKRLDFSTLERVNAKLHAEGLERRDGDLIYRVRLDDGSDVYLYLLLEFQSQPDPWMALRVLVYVGLLYQQLVREQRLTPQGQLPPVFPLVLYNGDVGWTAKLDLKELIALPAHTPLWPYQPTIRYYLLDEGRYAENHPGPPTSLVGVLFQIENCRHKDDLVPIINHLGEHWRDHLPASLRRALISWISRVVAPRRGGVLEPKDIESFSEVKVMLATRVKQWEKELINKGIEKGVLVGEAKLLHRQLRLRFGTLPAWAEGKIAAAQADALETWGARVLDAKTLEQVFAE